ncbi:translation initiation factor eIF3 subunit [Russula earlei]|uniref:Translation initiation factor eIF3 subunit n=1 Tax=Russula earlei TaxID=71964 RepID=A0ACC0UI21_9AGAM|nr:translation initiation factor eIF3 subunit [Russula earlei]
MSDWSRVEGAEGDSPARPVPKKALATKSSWEGEDGDDDGPVVSFHTLRPTEMDAVLDPRAKARLEKERELESDLRNATELFGSATVKGSSDADLDKILESTPKSKEEFITLSDAIIAQVVKRHQDKPLYAAFVEHHVRALAAPPRDDVDVRKAASGLTALANEKQREQREKTSGKEKVKQAGKQVSTSLDTTAYDEALDDFGTNPDDFMWCDCNG